VSPNGSPVRGRRTGRRVLVTALAFGLIASLFGPSPAAPAAEACTDPPRTFPTGKLVDGVRGEGWTVVKGTEPARFRVRVLGRLQDGIAPGLDFVLIKVSGRTIQRTGGIAAGFSGSPVYVGRRLAGAVSYGFFGADQTIGGMTPARQMVDLFGYPSSVDGGYSPAARVKLNDRLKRAAARASGETASDLADSAVQLPLPMGISGLNGRAMEKVQNRVERLGLNVELYRMGRAALSDGTAAEPLRPGQSLAGVLSYGDLTWAGIGTATAVCGDFVLGFGHPFFWEGSTSMGLSGANVLKVIPDPSQIFGGFKIAEVAELHGTLDQDRLAGVRGVEGAMPLVTKVRSHIVNPDIGKERTGTTAVVYQPWLYYIASFALLVNEDAVHDRIGDGTTTLEWTISGRDESGDRWSLTRDNMYFSEWDTTIYSIFELWDELWAIQRNRFQDVRVKDVDIEGEVTQEHKVVDIRKVEVASSLQPDLAERRRLKVAPGDTIEIKVRLHFEDGSTTVENLTVDVPKDARCCGELSIRRGYYWSRRDKAGSFQELLDQLAGAEHFYDLVAELEVDLKGDERDRYTATTVEPQDYVVTGSKRIDIDVEG